MPHQPCSSVFAAMQLRTLPCIPDSITLNRQRHYIKQDPFDSAVVTDHLLQLVIIVKSCDTIQPESQLAGKSGKSQRKYSVAAARTMMSVGRDSLQPQLAGTDALEETYSLDFRTNCNFLCEECQKLSGILGYSGKWDIWGTGI